MTRKPKASQTPTASRFRDRIRELRRIRCGDIQEHPRNIRRHSGAQLGALSGDLAERGKTRPLIAFPADGLGPAGDFSRLMYADGHGRAGLDPNEVWPVCVTDLTREEADRELFCDAIGEMATYDPVKLDALMKDVNTGCAELQQMLDDLWADAQKDAIADTEPIDEDTPPEPQAAVVTRPGDLWTIGQHRLLCGDCRDPAEWERLLGGERVDLLLTDPPYGIDWNTDYQSWVKQGNAQGSNKRRSYPPVHGDKEPFDPAKWLQFDRVILWGAPCFLDKLGGGTLLVWYKRKSDFLAQAEAAWMNSGYGVYVFEEPVEQMQHDGDRHHPTQKPISLMAWCIERCGDAQLIADPYAGSGTTIMACEALGRRCMACEIEPAYVDVCCRRWLAKYPAADPVRHDGAKWSELNSE